MKSIHTRNTIVVLTVFALVGIGATAFAGWGRGYGRHMGWGGGPGDCPGYGYGPRNPQGTPLSDEQIQAVEKERQAFMNDTADLREDLYAKELELRAELAKADPDIAKATAVQKDISRLESELELKRLDHMIRMRRINPDMGRGYHGGGYMMGGGRGGMRGYGPGAGYGQVPGRGGYCQ